MKPFFIFSLLPLLFYSCHKNTIDKAFILENFTPEEINFFWETAFSNDLEYKAYINDNQFRLTKWDTNICIHTFGDLTKEDSVGVENAVSELNNLNLSITAYWDKEKKDSSNYEIFFGTKEYIDQVALERDNLSVNFEDRGYFGICNTASNGSQNIAFYGFVGIRSECPLSLKPYLILHELINSLGLIGDPFSYPESVLNDAMIMDSTITRKHLADIDKRALALLYSPAIPSGISRGSFYKTFSDILPKRNKIRESDYTDLVKYIKNNQISEDVINTFYNQAFISSIVEKEPHISKWASHPVIHFADSIHPYSQKIIRNGVTLFNPLLPEKQKIILQPHDTFPYNVCVTTQGKYLYSDSYDSKGIQMTNVLIGDIPFSEDEKESNLTTTKVMMELLGGAYKQDKEFPKGMSRNICDTNYIRFFLSPVVKSGMRQEEIKKRLREYYKIDKQLEKDYKALDAYLSKRPLSDSVSNCLVRLLGTSSFNCDVIQKWDSVKIGISEDSENHFKLLKSLYSAISFIKMQVVNNDSCNLSISFVEDTINNVTLDEITIRDVIRFGHAKIIDRPAHIVPCFYSTIFGFNVGRTGFIQQLNNDGFTFDPHWLEAVKFYYSPFIQSGMKKEKVMEIILKYYPETESLKHKT
jgi:hypothetical protein